MKVKINITKEILEKSMYCPTLFGVVTDETLEKIKTNCAFSVAWRDIFPEAKVWQSVTHLTPNEMDVSPIGHSLEVINFIRRFDGCRTFEDRLAMPEASFEFEIPDSVIDRIGVNEVNEILSKSLTMEKV